MQRLLNSIQHSALFMYVIYLCITDTIICVRARTMLIRLYNYNTYNSKCCEKNNNRKSTIDHSIIFHPFNIYYWSNSVIKDIFLRNIIKSYRQDNVDTFPNGLTNDAENPPSRHVQFMEELSEKHFFFSYTSGDISSGVNFSKYELPTFKHLGGFGISRALWRSWNWKLVTGKICEV